MNETEIQRIAEQFPDTAGAKFVLAPWIARELAKIERSWHTTADNIDEMLQKAYEKNLLLRLARELKLNLDTSHVDIGHSSDSESAAGT